jgi:hypothetical protein
MMSSLQGENLFFPNPGSTCQKKLSCMYLSKLSKSVPLAVFAQSTFVRQGCSWWDDLGCL